MVGLLRQKVQPERLCLPAVFAAVGRAGHGERAVGQRPAAAAVRTAAGLAAAPAGVGRAGRGRAGPDRLGGAGGAVCGAAPGAGTTEPAPGRGLGHPAPPHHRVCGKAHPARLPGGGKAGTDRCAEGCQRLSESVGPCVVVRHRGVPGRRGGDHLLPGDGGRMDEPVQSGVGALQRGVGSGAGAGHRAAAPEPGQERPLSVRLRHHHGRRL